MANRSQRPSRLARLVIEGLGDRLEDRAQVLSRELIDHALVRALELVGVVFVATIGLVVVRRRLGSG